MHASYTVKAITPEKVFIVDNNSGGLSVTNDAEWVVADIYARLPGRRIIYRDSDGIWDELLHAHGRFLDFDRYTEELP